MELIARYMIFFNKKKQQQNQFVASVGDDIWSFLQLFYAKVHNFTHPCVASLSLGSNTYRPIRFTFERVELQNCPNYRCSIFLFFYTWHVQIDWRNSTRFTTNPQCSPNFTEICNIILFKIENYSIHSGNLSLSKIDVLNHILVKFGKYLKCFE